MAATADALWSLISKWSGTVPHDCLLKYGTKMTASRQGCNLHPDWGDKNVSELKIKHQELGQWCFTLATRRNKQHTTHSTTAKWAKEKDPQWIWGTEHTQRLDLSAMLEGWRSYSVQSQGLLRRRVKPHRPMRWPLGGKMPLGEVFAKNKSILALDATLKRTE